MIAPSFLVSSQQAQRPCQHKIRRSTRGASHRGEVQRMGFELIEIDSAGEVSAVKPDLMMSRILISLNQHTHLLSQSVVDCQGDV